MIIGGQQDFHVADRSFTSLRIVQDDIALGLLGAG
jgi:hypothetical protein